MDFFVVCRKWLWCFSTPLTAYREQGKRKHQRNLMGCDLFLVPRFEPRAFVWSEVLAVFLKCPCRLPMKSKAQKRVSHKGPQK
jgi:hypothetical protein